jgi:hypothetical protein
MSHFPKKFKNILLLLFVLTPWDLIAQQSPPVKIIFSYYRGGNSWGVPGIYGRGENIEITAVSANTYKISKYYKIVNGLANDSVTNIKDTTYLKTKAYRQISKSSIDLLFQQLNTNANNFNSAFIRPKLKNPTKKQILATSQRIDKGYLFEDDDDEDNAKIQRIEKFDKLDSFINLNKPKPGLEVVVTDASHGFSVEYISATDNVKFSGSFFQLLGQPIHKTSKTKYESDNGVVNLKINRFLSKILPPSSMLKDAIEIDNLTEDYIEWYIDKVL